ncbi:S53 family peptidase [Streptomyces barringtoniae]|uniref:S53 family peptidase n=1 Tax=Streptomyces barringtoniae TaxID=2892029 RepID=UPI001E4593F2|nr:S53 family peptidase [Streptomyces barringtoniae]MCC5480961.1 peptidase S53 [Streptomyces barringtoniae]
MVLVTDPSLPIPGTERRQPPNASRVGPADPDEPIMVSVQVRRKANTGLTNLARLGAKRPRDRQQADRAAQLQEQAADKAELELVEQFAKAHGLKKSGFLPPRTLQLSGTARQMNEAFDTQLIKYERPHVGPYRSREGHLRVPRHVAGVVERVSGLTTHPLARPLLRQRPRDAASYLPTQIAQMYDFPGAADGAGASIGIIELGGGYAQQDLDTFFQALGLQAPNVVAVSVDGAANNFGMDSGADTEGTLDIQVAGAVAPEATITVYFAPNTEQGFIDAVNTAVFDTQNRPSVLSTSWGAAEDAAWAPAGLNGLNAGFTSAATAAVSTLAAAGDNGSNDNVNDGLAHCDFPASDPYVIACGGTTLQGDGGQPKTEAVWNDGFGDATGGGISRVFALPSWQTGAGVPPNVNDHTTYGRGLPDVAGDADPNTGYDVVVRNGWTVVGGTSAVAPLYAGLFAQIIGQVGFPLGFITPWLYSLGPNGVVYDIDTGDNTAPPAPGYIAGAGWDACSGLGRIDGAQLLAAV